jgi:hypothetical protein
MSSFRPQVFYRAHWRGVKVWGKNRTEFFSETCAIHVERVEFSAPLCRGSVSSRGASQQNGVVCYLLPFLA